MKRIYTELTETMFTGRFSENIYVRPSVIEQLDKLSFVQTLSVFRFDIQGRDVKLEVVPYYFKTLKSYEEAKYRNPNIITLIY